MKKYNFELIFSVLMLFIAVFLFFKKIYIFITAHEIDYLRFTVNLVFVIYITYRIVEQRKNTLK